MTRIRRALAAAARGLRSALAAIISWAVGWAQGTSDRERLMYIGLVMLGAGVGMADGRLALALVGSILVLVAVRLPRQPSEG